MRPILKPNLLRFIIVLAYIISVSSCRKDQNSSSTKLPDLTQSNWKGTVVINENAGRSQADINVEFRTKTTGYFSLSKTTGSIDNIYATDSPFSYKPDTKILYIDGGYKNILIGSWFTIKSGKDELTMIREINNPKEADTLKITKIH